MGAATRKSAVRFHERAELLDFLLDVAAATSETLDLDRILANVASIVKDVIPYDLFAILLYSERQGGLGIRYSIGHREEVVRNLIIPLGEGITGLAASTHQPILVGDVRSDPRYLTALDVVKSELAVPMVARGKLVGVIDLQSTRLDAYREADRALLQLIASRVGVSIDNARLYRRADRQNRTLKTLARLSQEFSSILDLDELLGTIAKTTHALVAFDAFSILLLDSERRVLIHRFSERYDQRVDLNNIPVGKGITGAAAESREIVRVADTAADPRYIASHPDIRSEIAVPLMVQDRVVGVMDLESERMGYFTEEHARLLSFLAPQIASSVENARLYEELAQREQRMDQDLKAARNLQSVLLLRDAPEIEGLEIAIRSRSAREITGDVYDVFEHGSDYAVFAFGDVSGKGAAAALYGAMVGGLLRTLAHRKRSPAELLKLLNNVLRERAVEARYVTLMVLVWERERRRFVMANAGAEPPLICRQGEILKPHVEGVPAGLLDDREYEERVFDVQSGDLFLLFSDGITDQTNPNEEEYGRGHLVRSLRRLCGRHPEEVADEILADLDKFSGGAARQDDQTLIVLRVR
ncbi:MAG: SpoIIE family protein phosphatase [Bryobacteraceae bacterium]|jgi:sigma-B regulation protein RsbU (phosphoserine phosphatase)